MPARLFTPGPIDIPDEIRAALARPALHHRTAEFLELAGRVHEGLGRLLGGPQTVAVLASSGTGGLEAVVANLLAPGDRGLAVVAGKFGERWAEIARAYGHPVIEVTAPWGRMPSADELGSALGAAPGCRLVMLTQVETSTGTLADVRALAAVAREHGALVAVDAVSSLAVHALPMAQWGIDAVIGATQKALMLPPGAAIVGLSARAADAVRANPRPRFYFDLRPYLSAAPGDAPFTPPALHYVGLDASLARIEAEGFEMFRARHARLAEAVRAAARGLGLSLLSAAPSNVVTAITLPDGVGSRDVLRALEMRYGFRIARGQGAWKDRMIRIAHMGAIEQGDVLALTAALGAVLAGLGATPRAEAGVEAALASLKQPYAVLAER